MLRCCNFLEWKKIESSIQHKWINAALRLFDLNWIKDWDQWPARQRHRYKWSTMFAIIYDNMTRYIDLCLTTSTSTTTTRIISFINQISPVISHGLSSFFSWWCLPKPPNKLIYISGISHIYWVVKINKNQSGCGDGEFLV